MAKVSISEAARLTGKSRTTLHRLIKTGELSTCSGVRNTKMVDISELLRVFGEISKPVNEQPLEQVSEQRVTGHSALNEQVVNSLKLEVEHLRTLVSAQESHIDSLKQSLQLLEHKKDVQQPLPPPAKWWQFWK
ncbi:helix-turn-helix domain-containing protein [Erwinia sp. S59]|uniref:helix-turn-helix domain-containing protein n=1 Tax=Erwinia sp. S59 TaxID=2769340 RepID=UPI00190E1BD5|nr:helix-turn-helix domain-containing protein [Erwinia sp. S59]MBK0094310.1 helix-turn-helix domain-containing protein [Erwinia sp. S59]